MLKEEILTQEKYVNRGNCFLVSLPQAQGFVTVDEVQRRLNWSSGRATDALETLLEVSS